MLTEETRLGDVPEEWLRHIEPHVRRGPFRPCWMWTGAVSGGKVMYPRTTIKGKTFNVRRMVAEMFLNPPPGHWRVKSTCGHAVCLNPAHLEIKR